MIYIFLWKIIRKNNIILCSRSHSCENPAERKNLLRTSNHMMINRRPPMNALLMAPPTLIYSLSSTYSHQFSAFSSSWTSYRPLPNQIISQSETITSNPSSFFHFYPLASNNEFMLLYAMNFFDYFFLIEKTFYPNYLLYNNCTPFLNISIFDWFSLKKVKNDSKHY